MMNTCSFHDQMASALQTVRRILDLTRNPRYAEDEDHTYDDKFGLAEFLVNSSMAAQFIALENLGLTEKKLKQLMKFVHDEKRTVTLRFQATETCDFVREEQVEMQDPNQQATQVKKTATEQGAKTVETVYQHKVITMVNQYYWRFGLSYELFCYAGSDPDNHSSQVEVQSRHSFTTIITNKKKPQPFLPVKVHEPVDVSLTWLLQNLAKDSYACKFGIDRLQESCRTPRRNDQAEEALGFFQNVAGWTHRVSRYFVERLEQRVLGQYKKVKLLLDSINSKSVFVPILPLMETGEHPRGRQPKRDEQDENASICASIITVPPPRLGSPLLSGSDVCLFLEEQRRSLDEAVQRLARASPSSAEKGKLLSIVEVKVVLVCKHLADISDRMSQSVAYIEDMLRNQLISAIGKEVRPQDFEEYVRFHNQKLLGPHYAPGPFCYAIRRPNHYPDGILGIETNTDRDKAEPIESIVRKIPGHDVPSMYFPLNAATTIEFTGERYLHAWIQQRFASSPRPKPVLTARARQFSRFLLLVGNLAGADKFIPKDAIIVQNKDEITIPLLLNELPTPKEFKDAIASLSPEQQRFAKAYRGMQLESSVLGVCVIQLKPQLEALLGLPPDALTKEIGLTQDLLSLFIDYQIPSDLLSYDGPVDVTAGDKVETVKTYVKRVQEEIDGAKAKQLQHEIARADMRHEMSYPAPAPICEDRGRQRRTGVPSAVLPKFGGRQRPEAFLERAPELFEEEAYFGDGAAMATAMVSATIQPQQTAVASSEVERKVEAKPGQKITTQQREDGVQTSDFTAIPNRLDDIFDKHDKDNALHTTIIKTGDNWRRKRQENLLTKTVESHLSTDSQKSEKNKAFDLLDALSRSGSLPIDCGELHVVLGVTHCFENTVMGTVIEDNLNPIEKMEKSTLLIASVIHNVSTEDLIEGSEEDKLRLTSLFETSPVALAKKDESQ